MGIIVQRLPGDKPGEAVVSSILTTKSAQLERGTYEVNHMGDDRIISTGTILSPDFVQPGTMVAIDNKGVEKVGLLTKYSGRIDMGIDTSFQTTTETIK